MSQDKRTPPAIPGETNATRLPDPAPCPPWCLVPAHREPGWAESEIQILPKAISAGRTCKQEIGGVTWPVYDTGNTVSATVTVTRFQLRETYTEPIGRPDENVVYASAVRLRIGDDQELTPEAAKRLAALLTIAAERAAQ